MCPHAEAINTSLSLEEKPSHFAREEESQACEQWQKCLQPASFQARHPLRMKQNSLGCCLAIAEHGARSGCQAEGAGDSPECRLWSDVKGWFSGEVQGSSSCAAPTAPATPGFRSWLSPTAGLVGHLLSGHAERLQDQRRDPLRFPAAHRAPRPGLWLLLLWRLLPASPLDVSA